MGSQEKSSRLCFAFHQIQSPTACVSQAQRSLGIVKRRSEYLSLLGWGRLSILPWIALLLVLGGCSTDTSEQVKRGRLTFAKSLHALRIGEQYLFRNVSQQFFVNNKPWPPGDDQFAEKMNWCESGSQVDGARVL